MIAFTSVVRPVVRLAGLGAVVLLLGGCAGQATPPVVSPSPEAAATLPSSSPTVAVATVTPTAAPPVAPATPTAVAATATPSEPTPTTAAVDWADFESRTADGFYERGNPDAAILIRDYSDFL